MGIVAALQDEQAEGNIVGIDLNSGEPMDPVSRGVFDSFRVLRNSIASASSIASNLLLCDELLKARQMVSLIAHFMPLKVWLLTAITGLKRRTWRSARGVSAMTDDIKNVRRRMGKRLKTERINKRLFHICLVHMFILSFLSRDLIDYQ